MTKPPFISKSKTDKLGATSGVGRVTAVLPACKRGYNIRYMLLFLIRGVL
jgi:hypothetical protein